MTDKNFYIILPNGKSKMYSEEDFNSPNVQKFVNDKNNGVSVLEQVPYDINDKNTRDTDIYTLTLENGKSKDYTSAEFNSPNVQKWLGSNPKVAVSRFRQYNPYLDEAEQVGSDTDNAQYVIKPTDPNSNEPAVTISAEEYNANRDKYASTADRSVVRISPEGKISDEEFMARVDYDRKVKQLDEFLAANKDALKKYDTAMAGFVGDRSPAADMSSYIRNNPDSDIARAVAERERLVSERNANPFYQKLRKDSIAEAQSIINAVNSGEDKTRADRIARKFARKADKILQAPTTEDDNGNGFDNFIKGHKDTFNDVDFWTAGISAIVANSGAAKEIETIREKLKGKTINISDVAPDNISELKKYLSDDEIRLLQSLSVYAKAQADRALDTSNMYQAGATSAQSLEFMAEFLATGGISSAIRKGVGKVAGNIIEAATKNIGGNVARNIAIGATKTAEAIITPALQAAATTYLHPSSWRNISDAASYQFDQQTGDLSNKDFWTAFKETAADNFIETWSEMALDPIFGVIGEGLGKVKATGRFKEFLDTPLGQFGALISNNKVANTLRKAGFHGYVGEMLEEVLGAGTRQALGVDDKAWEQFWDKDNLGQMAVAFLPMSIVGAIGGGISHRIQAKKSYDEESPFIREMMRQRGYSESEINDKLSREGQTMRMIANNINDVVRSINDVQPLTEEEKNHLIRFAAGTASTQLYDALKEQEKTDAKNAINNELEQKLGRYWYPVPTPEGEEQRNEVREIKYADGNRVFVTSEADESGQMAVVDEGGKRKFINEQAISDGMADGSILSDNRLPLNDFLNNEREGRRKGAESARMDTEYREKLADVQKRALPGVEVNIGTAESPIVATIRGWNGEKFVVQSAERGAEEFDVNQMASALDVDLHVNTDAENEAKEEMDAKSMLDLSDQINEQGVGMVFTDAEGQKHTLETVFDTWQEEDGTWMAAIMSGKEEYDIPMADLSQQYSSFLAEKNNPSAAEETNETAPAESESAIEEPEQDNTPRDFRGNPLPLKEDGTVNRTVLWNKDPEAWAKWNDANPNSRINTKGYIQGRIDSLIGDIKKLEKAVEKETRTTGDFDAIDRLNNQIDEKLARQAQLQKILDNYAAEEKAAAEKEKARQLELSEPQSISQLAINVLKGVKAHSLNRDSFKKELGWGNKELSVFFPWWAKKGSGMSLDALAEKMVELDNQYGFVPMVGDAEQKDTQVAKDALIEVMQSISRPGELRDMVLNENKAYEDAIKDAQEAAVEAELMSRFGMTVDEYNALSDEERANLEDKQPIAVDLGENAPVEAFEQEAETGQVVDNQGNPIEQKKKQAIREGGELPILSPETVPAASLSALPDASLSVSKDTEIPENANVPEENSAEDLELNGELYNISDLESQFRSDVEMLLEDNGVDVEVVGVKLIGSRIAGSPRVDSDLDLLVEYKGDYSEDALFNLLNSEEWEFNGVKLDINPITEGKSGTIEQFLKRNADFVKNEPAAEEETGVEDEDEMEDEGPVAPVHVTGAQYEVSPNAASEEEIEATSVTEDDVNAIRFGGWDVFRSERTGEEIKTYGGTTLFSPGNESGVHVTMTSANGGRREGDSTAEYLAKYLKANGFVSIETEPAVTKNKYGYWINKHGVITGAETIILESSKKGWANSSYVCVARLDNGNWVAEDGRHPMQNASEQFGTKADALKSVLKKLKEHYEAHKDESGNAMFGPREKKDEQNLIKHLENKVIPAELLSERGETHDFTQDEVMNFGEVGSLFGEEGAENADEPQAVVKKSSATGEKKASRKKTRPDGALFDTDENFDEDVVNTTDVPVEVIVYPGNEDNPQACRIHLFEKDGKWNSVSEVWADNGGMSKAGTNSGSYPYNSREEAIEKAVSYFKWYRDNKAADWGTDGINEFLDYVAFIPKAVERAKESAPKEAEPAINNTTEAVPADESKGQYGANNKLVTTERYEELKKRMIAKMNQLNLGFDPETLAIGCEMAAYHIEAGARKFIDYAQRMIADLGDAIRPYLKSMYNGARDLPGMEDYAAEMDSYDEVSATDVKNIGLEDNKEYNEGDLVIYKGKSMKIVGVHPKTLDLEYNPTGFMPLVSMGVPVTDVTKFISFHTEDISDVLEAARQEVNTEPTESQKEAGNYKKGHVKIEGYDFTMENPKGSVRKGVDKDGNAWEITMNNDYGYIRGTKGVDGDHIDMFLSDNPEQGNVYVVDQVNPDGSFDEHKVMYGFNSAEEAQSAYLANYSEGWQGLGNITPVSKEEFKKWIESSTRKTKPFAEYASVKPLEEEAKEVPAVSTLGTITKDKHTKTGEDLWVVKPSERVSSEDFKRLKTSAKQNGGYWSSFKHGFIFTDEESANKFNNSNTDNNAETTDEQTAAITDAIISKAGSIAEEASALAESKDAADGKVSEATEQIDNILSVIDDQLAILGYYSADKDSQFDESFGYSKSAQKKAIKDVNKLAKSIAADLGIDAGRGMLAKANIAPAGGDVYFHLPLLEGRELYVTISVEPKDYINGYGYNDDLVARGSLGGGELAIMWRIENPSGKGYDRYGGNHHERANVPYLELLQHIRAATKDYIPAQPEAGNIVDTAEKVYNSNRKKKENSIPLNGDDILGGLFDTLADEDTVAKEKSEPAPASAKPQKPTEINGYKVGDIVRYSYPGREPADVRIVDFEDGRPVLDSFGANWITELADWEYISRIEEPQNTEDNERIISTGSTGEDRAVGEGDRQADEQSVTSGVDRGGQLDSSSDGSRSGRVAESDARRELEPAGGNSVTEKKPRKSAAKKNTHNNSAKRGESFAPTTPAARFAANVAAIKKMRELVDGEKSASKDDMAVLRQFTGWGGLGTFFNDKYSQQYRTLNELLSPEEMQDAEMSINSAYFTPVNIIDRMWDVAKKLGFEGGRILEGSAGIGNILQQMPKDISEESDITAVEIDSITGNILKLLYPDADVQIKGFQDVRIPNNSVDLAITNVPFVTGLSVFDEAERDLSRKFTDIHDFCIAKNVRKLKEGGIGIFITSKGTLDKSKKLRQWVVNDGSADFIGAFRLNNETFGGTSVTSDIIVIRKRVGGKVSPNAIDVSETAVTRRDTYHDQGTYNYRKREWDSKDIPVAMEYNSYFVEHPEYMAGEMLFGFDKNETFRPTSVSLYPKANIDQDKALARWARDIRNDAESSKDVAPAVETVNEGTTMKEGQMLVNSKGEICLSRQGKAVPIDDNGKNVKGYSKATVLKDYNAIKNALNDVLNYQLNNESDEGLKPLLGKLNAAYDTFKRKYGQLNRNVAISFLRDDVDFASTAAIENYREKEGADGKKQVVATKTDIFNKRMIGYKTVPTPSSAKDGILVSMNQFGRIDTAYIAKALGRDEDDVRKEILDSGLAFMDPMTGTIEVSYRYLSGNVREKLAYARMHNDDKRYDKNIEALEKVVPADIPAHIIEFSLGSDWVDKKLYRDYAKDRFGVGDDFNLACIGGVWQLVGNTEYFDGARGEKNRSAGVTGTVVPKTVYGHQLMIAAMNNTAVTFQRQEEDPITGSKVTITDRAASQAASQKMEEMKEDFRQWAKDRMMQDTELAERTKETYNNLFNAYAPIEIDDIFMPERFDGSVLTMKDKPFSLYKHQKRATIRGTMEPVMLAHEVGAGKTYTLISTAMEMRRLGTAKKPMIVVQNATIGQFVTSAKELYPNAKILTVSDRDHTVEGRATFYAKIKYNDWDLIIVPQSVFDEIPDSEERKHQFVQEKIDEKMYVLAQAKEANADNAVIRQMQKELEDLEYELNTGETKQASKKRDAKKEAQAKENAAARAKKQLARKVDDVSDFDDMGIDAVLVDEAHNYKKLGFSTSIKRGVKGVDTGYSQRAAGLYLKTRSVFDKKGWKNVVFATGTPISNTAAEIWTFMKYLMPADIMKQNHIYYFDDFVRNFGNIAQSLEFATNGKFKENTRFGAYVNVPELVRIWSSVCDTVLSKDAEAASGQKLEDKLPKIEGGKAQDVFLPQSPSLVGIMKQIRKELEDYEKMSGKEKKENSHIPLTCYGRAKKAAIDPRLVSSTAKDEPLSKTNKAVETILQDYDDTKSYKGTCAVFCDNFQRLNKETKAVEFNLFDEIKSKLVAKGIPEDEIVIMKSGMGEKKKEQIFSAVNAGDIRVILGSTQTLGTGVNIQERLHMVIHMDAPDRPMDYTQRNGRILRQGNKHLDWGKTVKIVRFGVEDSLDVTSYQRLKTKSAFIDSIMNGKQYLDNSMENRTLEEEEEGLFDSPVAVLSGSEFALLKTQAERELRKYQSKYQQHKQDQIYIEKQLKENTERIGNLATLTERYNELLKKVHNTFKDGKVKVATIEGRACRNEEEINAVIRERINPEIKRFQQRALSDFWSFHKYEGTIVKTYNFDFDGIPASVKVSMRTDYDSKSQQVVKTKYYFNCPELGVESEREMSSIRGAVTYFEEQLATGLMHENSLSAYRNLSEKLKTDNAEMLKRRGKEFAETDKLNQAKARVDEFTEKMKEEMAAKEAKYAAMASEDVSIDDSDDFEDETGASETHNRETNDDNETLLDVNDPLVVSSAMSAVRRIQDRIGVPVRFVRGSDAKGHYTEGENEVVINIGAHSSIDDVVETYLHEAVAHFGLRQLMGEEFDSFIDDVWNNCTEVIRGRIRAMMIDNGWSQTYAVEEYIAELAQKTDYTKSERSLWRKVVEAVRNIINAITGRENLITDATIREILRSSYRNLENNTTEGYSSDEIARMETPILRSKGTFVNLSEAERWAKDNLQRKSFVNKYSGSSIAIGKKSIKEMLGPKASKSISEQLHLKALMSVPEFIESGIPAEVHKDIHGRGFDVMRLYSAIEIDGEIYRVKSTVKRVAQGDKYYTYELQEMEMIEGAEISVGSPRGTNLVPQSSSIKSITGAKLLKGVKKTNSEEEILNSSYRNSDTGDNKYYRGENTNQAIFVSNALKAVEALDMGKASGEQWLKAIQGRGGLKAAEDKWLGLSDFLAGKKSVTKDEVLIFIGENAIRIEETKYDESASIIKYDIPKLMADQKGLEFRDKFYDAFDVSFYEGDDAFSYEGEHYEAGINDEELAVELYNENHPNAEVTSNDVLGDVESWANEVINSLLTNTVDVKPIKSTRLSYTTENLTNKREIALTVPTIEPWGEDDNIHFGDAGEGRAIAWARFGDAKIMEQIPAVEPTQEELTEFERLEKVAKGAEDKVSDELEKGDIAQETADAYNKAVAERDAYQKELNAKTKRADVKVHRVLFIDEIQSKRHQDGREHGYKPLVTQEMKDRAIAAQKAFIDFETMTSSERKKRGLEDQEAYSAEYRRIQAEYRAAMDAVERRGNTIPAAPFEKNWHELAMKRMLRLAAEEGYDKVAWTTGETQAERYGIGKVITSIFVGVPLATNTREVVITKPNGYKDSFEIMQDGTITGAIGEWGDFNGKNVVEVFGKNIGEKILNAQPRETIDGNNLRIGGEGMKGFYDKILVDFMNKYGKKWGVKVSDEEIPNIHQTAHIIDITPEMAKSVKEGQMMFRAAYHGSKADFERFDLSHVGEGEGAQAHGYGVYVAFDEKTGTAYANDSQWRASGYVYDGINPITKSWEDSIVKSIMSGFSHMSIAASINHEKENLEWSIQWAKKHRPDRVAELEEALNFVNGLDASDFSYKEYGKNLYTVEIPENDGTNYIDEMKTLPKDGRRRIADVVRSLPDGLLMRDAHGPNWLPNGVQTLANAIENNQYAGLELRRRLVDAFGSEQFASEIFSNAGFVGMLYDGRRDGECAVIFNTDDLFIMEHTHFRLREKPAPKKTGIGYKVFFQKNGKLYPPMVANPNGEDTPVGVWLDADAAPIAGSSKTGRPQVKAGGKGTQGGSGQLAYRPGWHLGTIPYAIQFNRKDENGEKTLFPKDFVWAEVEYAADKDYQKEAEAEGINASGKYQHSLAGLKRLPEDGFYTYRTNPNPETDPWIITGSMKVNKVLTRAEVDALVREAGREPQRVEGDARKQGDNESNNDYNKYLLERAKDKMNIAVPAEIMEYPDVTSVKKFFSMLELTDAEAERLSDRLLNAIYSDKKMAYFGGLVKKILIFGSVKNDADDFELSLLHECIHQIDDASGHSLSDRLGSIIIEHADDANPAISDRYAVVKRKYNEKDWKKEMLAYVLSSVLHDNGSYDFLEGNDDFDTIVKSLNYGEYRRNNAGQGVLLHSAGREDGGNSGVGNDGGREAESSGRNNVLNYGPGYTSQRDVLLHSDGRRNAGNNNLEYDERGTGESLGRVGQEVSDAEPSRDRRRTDSYGVSASLPAREAAASATADKLGVKVNVVSRENMPRGHEFSLGTWNDGEIYICPENCADEDDVAMTVIHEAVGHNGLRKLVGNENMDNFCMDLFRKSTEDVRRAIIDYSRSHGYNFVEGTEEYLAHLSETMDFTEPERTFWDKVKEAVRSLLAKVGINVPVDGRDLRWLLWQSYNANKRGELANDVERAVMAHRLGFSLKADKDRDKARRILRDRVVDEKYAESAAAMYNRAATNWRARLKETWVDQFSAVDELVKAIEQVSGKKVKSFEDVRKALNQQSSKGLDAMERWENEFYIPMETAVKSCMSAANCSLEDVERYVMLKHGLERNEKFAKRDAREFYQAIFDATKKRLLEDEKIDADEREKLIKKAEEKLKKHLDAIENGTDAKYNEFREKDYGGLTALYSDYEDYEPFNPEVETEEEFNERVNRARKPRYDSLAATELAATQEVKEWEDKFGDYQLELWARINAATKDTLKHQYESNMISRSQYEHVRDMFDYYVPLRGFKETTADDMYSYYMSDQSRSFEQPLLKAKGRSTEAESPFGYVGAMASSAIAADMKNQTKLALYYMVSNRAKNDLVTISDVWYENTGVDELGRRVFSPVYPEFSDDLSSAEMKKAYEDWEAGMQEKAKSGFAFKGKKNLDLHDTVMNIDSRQERSHVIKFKLGGEDKMMFINGNPRAAQAINGELNVETSADYQKVFGKVLRWFSGINTSYNPEFWLSNMQRDILTALMSVSVKEDAAYNAEFRKNLGKAMKNVAKMSKAYKKGELGDSQIETLYREFAEGGGITGYTTLKKNEEWELQLKKFTGKERKSVEAVRDAFDKVQQFGEAIEQMTRFAAYMTSRQQGRSIVDSVSDAKELTVNFNRKGSGKSISWKEADKLRKKNGQKLTGVEKALLVGASWLPAYGRRFIMFFNASVQGLNMMYNLYKGNKGRFNTWTAAYLALGMMTAVMHALLDDDDDYLDIPDYERRNNLLIGAGGVYFKWAMPQETRIFYGLGDMIVNHVLGRTPDKNIIAELLASMSDIAPLNPAGGLSAIAPSALTPIVELAMNRDYKGSRIFNDMKYLSDEEKKRTPKYLSAFRGTGRVYINFAQGMNWLTGGDYTDAGLVNLNPAAIEHLVEGFTGGAGTTIEKTIQGIGGVIRGAVQLAAGDNFEGSAAESVLDWLGTDDFMLRNTPFIRRIVTLNDERYRNAHTTDLFNYYKAEAEHTKKRMNQYINAGDADKFNKLLESGDIDIMNVYNSYKGIMETYNTMIREAGSNRERRELVKEQDAYRKEMIKEISEIE